MTKLTKKKEQQKKEEPPAQPPLQQPPEEPQETRPPVERPPLSKSLLYPFKVLASPLRAFKELVLFPDVRGVVAVIGLVLIASAYGRIITYSKIFLNINSQPTSLLATDIFPSLMLSTVIESIFIFSLKWLIFTVALLIVTIILGVKRNSWRSFFILIGYAFSVIIVQTVFTAALFSTLPAIVFNLSTWPPASEADITLANDRISAEWGSTIAFRPEVSYFNLIFFDAWLVALTIIAVRGYRQVTWNRAVIISITAYLLYLTMKLFMNLP